MKNRYVTARHLPYRSSMRPVSLGLGGDIESGQLIHNFLEEGNR